MMLRISLAIIAFTLVFTSASCSKSAPKPSAAESALSSKAGDDQPAAGTRFLARENLTAARSNALADFIIPEVRMRLDEEPGSQDEAPAAGVPQEESGELADTSETAPSEDSVINSDELHNMKFSWAKKKFGEAIKKDETVNGVFVLYADENYYDVGRLLNFIEEGRDKIAANSEVDPGRIQVVFGGYRGLAQVEFWVVAQGERMPDPKPEERGSMDPKEN